MKAELKKRLQCNNCDMPYCDIPCSDLPDKDIDWIMKLANQRVIEELETLKLEQFDANFYQHEGFEAEYAVKVEDIDERIKELKTKI